MQATRRLFVIAAAALLVFMGQTATDAATPEKKPGGYPKIVDAGFVKPYAAIPRRADVLIIDSRPTARKYDKGHIPVAVSIPDRQFDKMTDLLPQDKSTLLIFYCGGLKCPLSPKAAAKALALGYTNVKLFQAGYPAWVAAYGKQAAAAAPASIVTGEEEGMITIASFKNIVAKAPDSIHLIDVRDAEELAAGTFKPARKLPLDDLEGQIAELPTDKPIVFVCSTGARSGEAYDMVRAEREGLKVYFLNAEVTHAADGSYTIAPPTN